MATQIYFDKVTELGEISEWVCIDHDEGTEYFKCPHDEFKEACQKAFISNDLGLTVPDKQNA